MKLSPSQMMFKFGEGIHASLGTIEVRIPAQITGFVCLSIDFFDLDVPILIGLRELRREGLLAGYIENKITQNDIKWIDTMYEKRGHIFWNQKHNTTNFSEASPSKFHPKKIKCTT